MFKVYISSTFDDLEDFRRAALDAVLVAKYLPVGMEHYRAGEGPPLDRCLQDVRTCDAYIGIFAWKFGFRPGNGEKSITQLEYEEAAKNKIPRYIFLLQEEANWPRKHINAKLAQLRDPC